MTRIAIDGLPLFVRSAGVARYTAHLATALAHEYQALEIVVFAPPMLKQKTSVDTGIANLGLQRSWLYPFAMGQPWSFLPDLQSVEAAIGKIDIFHATSYVAPRSTRAKVIVNVHDLALVRHPSLGTARLRAMIDRCVKSLDSAARIITASEATMRDLVELCGVSPDKIRVIVNGCAPEFYPRDGDESLDLIVRSLGISGPIILHVGTREPRKNLPTLMHAFARLRKVRKIPHTLVLAGADGWSPISLAQIARDLAIEEFVRFPGEIPADLLPYLYCAAEVFVCPSLYEGFGFPVLEAMASGTPVVCSNTGALPEVVGEAGLLVDPRSEAEIASAIEEVLDDPALACRLRTRGIERAGRYCWKHTAAETYSVYREVLTAR